MKKLLLIDGNSLLYRAYYATAYSGPLMKTSKGVHTNALYPFAVMMLNVLESFKFSHLLVAFDAGKKTFRHTEFKDYKDGRKPTPPELKEQIPLVRVMLDHFHVPHFEIENYEADDIIGTIAKQAYEKGFTHVDIISGDKDLLQLINEQTTVHLTRRGLSELESYTIDTLNETWGITPEQVVDLKGLMGDASDNIPGIPGVGEKTALKLLKQFGTVEEIIENIDQLKGKLKERVEEHQELARMSKQIATIHRDVPLTISLDDILFESLHVEDTLTFFNEYEFHSLIKRFDQAGVEMEEEKPLEYQLLDEKSIDSYLLPNAAIIVEGFGQNYHTGELLGIAISHEDVGHGFIPQEVVANHAPLKDYLEDESIPKITFDYKQAYIYLNHLGISFKGVTFDLLTAAYILNPSSSHQDMRVLTSHYGYQQVDYDETIYGKNTKYKIPDQAIYSEHAVKKAVALRELKPQLLEQLKNNDQLSLYETIELPLTPILAEMEITGVQFDIQVLDEISESLEGRLQQLESEAHRLAGKKFNLSSPKQLGIVLFEDLDLKVIKKTKTGYSTSVDVLEKLQGDHPIIDIIMDYRTLSKLYSTYVVGLKNSVHEDGKIHTIFNQTLTQTGRLSSVEPNIQNIPIRYEEGRAIRKAFIPSQEDNYILTADYSQIELRVLAHLADADNLVDAFVNDFDIHTKTAMDVFDVAEEEVTPLMRRQAKAVNFGIIYGISAFGLSENLHITPKEAQTFIDKYLTTYPGIEQYMERIVNEAKETGYATTIFNRRRYIDELKHKNYNIRMFGERTAMNAPIQGSAADIIKVAMIRVYNRMKQENLKSQLIIQVHDELIFDVYPDELETMQQLVKEEMEQAVQLKVPLKVGIDYGKSWYDTK